MVPMNQINESLKQHTCAVIDEYLTIARYCVDTVRPGGGVWGYPAALILFSATDAIGRGILPRRRGNDARLEVLNAPPFNLTLPERKIDLLRAVYRNPLSHNGQLGHGGIMSPLMTGEPFEFEGEHLVHLRVPVFCGLVERAWAACRSRFLPSDGDSRPAAFRSDSASFTLTIATEATSSRPVVTKYDPTRR
jgi:hypothetical protein